VGLILLVALLFATVLALLGPLARALSLVSSLGEKLICAARLADSCDRGSPLAEAYGIDLARAVRRHAPAVLYERGMRALPVDFRSCRAPACSDARGDGVVIRSQSGEPVTAFVHVIDCRDSARALLVTSESGADCSGDRAGSLYLQYWFFYPDSATLRGVPIAGARGYHRDDWESFQVRIGRGGDAVARASSHRAYNYGQGAQNWGAESGIAPLKAGAEVAGLRSSGGWGPDTGTLFVSGGSHAGNAKAGLLGYSRITPPGRLKLVPLEPIVSGGRSAFAVAPPWQKLVWRDPEAESTG
jgi:hypothetical protein